MFHISRPIVHNLRNLLPTNIHKVLLISPRVHMDALMKVELVVRRRYVMLHLETFQLVFPGIKNLGDVGVPY